MEGLNSNFFQTLNLQFDKKNSSNPSLLFAVVIIVLKIGALIRGCASLTILQFIKAIYLQSKDHRFNPPQKALKNVLEYL